MVSAVMVEHFFSFILSKVSVHSAASGGLRRLTRAAWLDIVEHGLSVFNEWQHITSHIPAIFPGIDDAKQP